MEKHSRARCAIRQLGRDGADLVIELPTPYALASAQGFARGAVRLLESTGICSHLSFGSESGDLDELRRVAGVLESGEFSALLREKLALGLSFAAARQSVPFSPPLEVVALLVAFEILQEAGQRIPQLNGQSVSIIGSLVVGQAAVDAKLLSPVVVVVVVPWLTVVVVSVTEPSGFSVVVLSTTVPAGS